eukprot:COSAG02_NODE_31276_length_536_cov_0.947368_1_plen_32_part_10
MQVVAMPTTNQFILIQRRRQNYRDLLGQARTL